MSTISTTITHGITLGTGGNTSPLTVTGTGYISNNHTASAIYAGYAGTVVNQGRITVTAPNVNDYHYIGIAMAGGGSVFNSGTITGDDYAGISLGFGGVVTNTGFVAAGRSGLIDNGDISLNNSGTVTGAVNGVFVQNGNATITNTGSIYGNTGLGVLSGYGTIDNAGTVLGLATYGIVLSHGGTIINQAGGLIQGTYYIEKGGIEIGGANYTATSRAVVNNAGTIIDAIRFYAANTLAQTVINSGSIVGTLGTAIAFSSGNDLLQFQPSTSAFIEGLVDGGGGVNTLAFLSGASAGTLTGNDAVFTHFSQGSVATGATWLFAGTDTLGADVSLAVGGNLTITGTLANAGTVSASSQGIMLAGTGLVTNSAGGIITGPNFGMAIDGLGAGTVVNSGSIGTLTASLGVSFASGGSVTNNASATITGIVGVFVNGAAGTVQNSGAILGNITTSSSDGVVLNHGGTVSNASGGTISGHYGVYLSNLAGASLSNTGVILGSSTDGAGAFIGGGGTITNLAGGTISGLHAVQGQSNAATVVNAGSLSGGSTTSGVYLRAGGALTNQTGGTITAGTGVFIANNTGTVVNAGRISGNSTVSFTAGIEVSSTAGSVTNLAGGTITGFYGVEVFGATIVSNAGSIGGARIGVSLRNGGFLTNLSSGVISGTTDAVSFASGHPNRLVVAPGATFIGTVDGGNTLGAASVSTLELASGSGIGTISGFGASFVHFGAVTLDAGAQWEIIGSAATTALGGATISGFAAGDTIDLTGFAAVSRTFASNALVLTDSIGSHATLTLPGTFTATNFAIASDGSGGTDITLLSGPAILNYGTTLVETGILAVSETVDANGTLTLFNSASVALGTIDVGTTLGTGDFRLTTLGGNTYLTLNTVFGTYTSGVTLVTNPSTIAATAKVSGTVTNAGAVYGPSGTAWVLVNQGAITETGIGGRGVSFNGSATLTNLSTGTIGAQYGVFASGSGGTVRNAGTIGGSSYGVFLGTAGQVTNLATGTITGGREAVRLDGSGNTVVNAGGIGSLSGTANGVWFVGSGALTNQLLGAISGANAVSGGSGAAVTVLNAGVLYGFASYVGDAGVLLQGGGAVTNQATATISGYYGIRADNTAIAVTNAGSIVSYGINAYSIGVALNAGGTLTNQAGGVITGRSGVLAKAAATVTNAGVLSGTAGNGVWLQAGGTVANQSGGLISGSADAVLIVAGATARVIDAPNAVFSGTVDGGNTIGSSIVSTLELASGASAGTLTGLGTQFVNFAQLTVDSGARWVLGGGNSIASGMTATVTGTLTDTGTLTNAGRIAGRLTLSGTGAALANLAGSVLTASGTAIAGTGGPILVSNAGSITASVAGGYGFGVRLTSGGWVTNQSGGVIAGQVGVGGAVVADTVVNAGTIRGSASNTGIGVYLAAGGTITNQASALVTAQYAVFATGQPMTLTNAGGIVGSNTGGVGIELQGGGAITNQSGGSITGGYGVLLALAAGTVVNAGRIIGYSPSVSGSALYLGAGGAVTNQAGGTLSGVEGIHGVTSAVAVLNAGAITGNMTTGEGVTLAGGGSVTNQDGGAITGKYGLRASSQAVTVVNAGSIGGNATATAGAGIALIAGGLITNQAGGTISGFTGIAAQTIAATIVDSGTIIGSGGTAIAFGAGNDLIQFAPGAVYVGGTIDGGAGTNTLQFLSAAGTGTFTGSNANFTNFAYATIAAGANWVFAGTNTLGAAIHLVDAGTLTNSGSLLVDPPMTITGTFINTGIVSAPGTETAMRMTDGSAVTNAAGGTITAGQDAITTAGTITISNQGVLQGGSNEGEFGIHATGSAFITNGASGNAAATIAGFYGVVVSGSASIANFGTVAGGGEGIAVSGGAATITNYAGGLISANTYFGVGGIGINVASAASGSVLNFGSINGWKLGVALGNGGVLVNGGSAATSARISSTKGTGVYAHGTATVTNYGTIASGNGYISASGVNLGGGTLTNFGLVTSSYLAVNFSGAATLANSGSIAGGRVGVQLAAGGLVNNTGTITGTGTAADGVDVFGAGTVIDTGVIQSVNRNGIQLAVASGSVTVANGGVVSGNRGVYLFAGGTVVDAGTISGTSGAVVFQGGTANLLVLQHGYALTGGIIGATSASNTVELQGTSSAAAVTVTYNSLGLTNVGTIAFAAGDSNYATLKITNAATLPATIVNFAGAHDTIDLTGLAFVSGSSSAVFNTATDQLVIGNGTSSVTLQLGAGDYSSVGFTATSDGVTGTDITIGSPVATYNWIGGSGSWQGTTNWSSGIVPGVSATATIANPGSNTVTIVSADTVSVAGVTLSNSDTLRVDGALTPTAGIYLSSATVTVGAAGAVTGTYAIRGVSGGSAGTVVNAGQIIGTATNTSIAGAISLTAGGVVTNQAGGTIAGMSGITARYGAATVVNQGSIGGNAASGRAGVYLHAGGVVTNQAGAVISGRAGLVAAAVTLVNAGSIQGNPSAGGLGAGVQAIGGGTIANQSGGTIAGTYGIIATGAAIAITNAGLIASTPAASGHAGLRLLSAALISNQSSGTISGFAPAIQAQSAAGFTLVNDGLITVSSSFGASAIALSYGASITNAGTIIGGGAITGSGTDAATLIDSGTIIGTAGTAIALGAGDDVVQFQASTSVFIQGAVDGGSGSNTLTFAAGTGTLTGSAASFANFATATIGSSAHWALAGSNTLAASTTLVDSGSLTVAGTLVNSGAMTIANALAVSGTLINSGSLALGSAFVSLLAGGYLLNAAGGSITGISGHGTTFSAPGVSGLAGGASSVVNLGTIADTQFTAGVKLLAGGAVINGATANTASLIEGQGAVYVTGGAGTVSNFGTLASLPTAAGQTALVLIAGGVVTNGAAGSTAALIDGTNNGIDANTITTITNFGTIRGDTGRGIALSNGGTVIDAGSIIGGSGTAVVFGGTNAGRLVLEAGYALSGAVVGSASASSSALELASTSGVGTLTGIGTNFVNFTDGTVDAGASWVLAGTNAVTAGMTLIVAGTLTDTGTLINAGQIAGRLTLSGTAQLTNAVGGTIAGSGTVIAGTGGAVTVVNAGSITASVAGGYGFGVRLTGGGLVSNQSGGVIAGQVAIGGAIAADTVDNAGTIRGSASNTGIGVYLASGGTITNQASALVTAQYAVFATGQPITLTNSGGIAGNATSGVGIELQAGGAVTNQSGGSITGGYGVLVSVGAGTVVNAGRIVGYSTRATGAAAYFGGGGTLTNLAGGTLSGVQGVHGASTALTVVNSGSLAGSLANGEGVSLAGGGAVTNQTGGVLSGKYGLRASSHAATVVNAGRISGDTAAGAAGIALLAGGLVTNQSGGTISGFTGLVAQTIAATLVDSGTLIGSGGTAASFGAGNDTLQFVPDAVYVGGTLDGGAGTNALQFLSAAGTGTFTGANAAFVNFANATVAAGASWVFAGTNTLGANTSLVDAGTLTNAGLLVVDPPLTVTGSFINSSIVSATGTDTAFYLTGSGVLTNSSGATITAAQTAVLATGSAAIGNLDVLQGGTGTIGYGIVANGTNSITNGASGTTAALIGGRVGVSVGGSASVVNYATIAGTAQGIAVAGTAHITNAIGASITGGAQAVFVSAGGSGTVLNLGTIAGTLLGVQLQNGSTLVNGASTITTAQIVAGSDGVYGVGSVTNYGTIRGGGSSAGDDAVALDGGQVTNFGLLVDTNAGGARVGGGGTVVNSGTILGGLFGVQLDAGGSVTNTGTILTTGTTGYGVQVFGAGGTVADSGRITGGIKLAAGGMVSVATGGVVTAGTMGIVIAGGGTVIDRGTISADTNAIAFSGGTANLLVLQNGYALSGAITGATSASNTLQLLGTSSADAVTVNYSSLGLTNFGTVAFAAGDGNYATLKITNAATLPALIVNFAGQNDTIDLSGLGFVSGSSSAVFDTATHRLVVGNGSASVTLQLGAGNYSGIGFTATTDGLTGTDIIIGSPIATYRWIGGSADWQGATNWSSGIVPGLTASATIANAGSNTVTIGAAETVSIAGLTLSSGNTLLVDGSFTGSGAIGVTGAALSIADTGHFVDNGTLTDAGSITGGITIGSSAGPVSIASGAYFGNGSAHSALYSVYAATITNQGTLRDQAATANATGYYAIRLTNGGSVTNSGSILANGFVALGLRLGASLTNTGLISAGRDGVLADHGISINNSGTIRATSDAVAERNGDLTLVNSGTLTASSAVLVQNGFATISNQGLMAGAGSDALQLAGGGTITNQAGGVITTTGTHNAIYLGGATYTAVAAGTITNFGTISGGTGIRSFGGNTLAQTVIDAGAIIGTTGTAVAFSVGNDVLRFQASTSALIQGVVDGGGGTNTLEFLAGAGTLTGSAASFANFGNATVDAGADWTLAGTDSFASSVTLAVGGTLTASGTLTNAGRVLNSAGQIALHLGDGAVLTNQASGVISASDSIAGVAVQASLVGTVANLGTIQASGTAGSGVDLQGGGALVNGASGTTTALISADGAGVIVGLDGGGSVTNYGTILAGNNNAITLLGTAAGAGITNHGLLRGRYGAQISGLTATIANDGTIRGTAGAGVYLAGGNLTNAASGQIVGTLYGVKLDAQNTHLVTNSGTITGDVGIQVYSYGTYLTAQTIIDSGTITGTAGTAIALADGNDLVQFVPGAVYIGGAVDGGAGTNVLQFVSSAGIGTLTGYYASFVDFQQATIDSGARWVFTGTNTLGANTTLVDAGTLTNSGLLVVDPPLTVTGSFINSSTVTASGTETAIYIGAGGIVTNTAGATLSASGGDAILAGGTATIVNQGTIIGSYGISLAAGGTVTNAGTIASNLGTSGNAVAFGSATSRLIVDPGAVFVGQVSAGSGPATLELASAASAGTLTGLGSSMTGFDSLVFDAGAQWTVIGNASASGLGTLAISGFNFGDTIDLTGFVAVSRSFGSNALVLTDGIGNHTTLAIAGSFDTSQFQIASDGGTGTDIWLQNLPVITANGTAAFTGGGSPMVLDGSLAVSDLGSATLASATIAINSGFVVGDILNYTSLSGLGIIGNYNTATGTLTLSGTASVADYQAALDSITYSFSPGNGDPTAGGADLSRSISWIVNDGTAVSQPGTSVLNVIHAPPTITIGGTASFSGGGSPVVLDGSIAIADPDSGGFLAGATIAINSGSLAGDVLNYASLSGLGIIGNYNTATGVLTLSGSASIANYESALESVAYSFSPGNGDPTGGGGDTSRAITWSVNDGVVVSNIGSTVLNVAHVAPSIVASGTVAFASGGTAVVLDSAITVADPDSGDVLNGASVWIGGGFLSGDMLNYASLSGSGIIGNYNTATGTLTLSGTASIANYQSALASITYSFTPGDGDPTAGGGDLSRSIDWQVTDGAGSAGISNTGTSTLTLSGPAPVINGTSAVTADFIQQGTPVIADAGISLIDSGSTTLVGATVAIASGFRGGDLLSASTGGTSIIANYNTATGVLTLSGSATLAQYQQVLRSVTYASSASDPSFGGTDFDRTLTWQIDDGRGTNNLSNTGTTTIATHVRPIVTAGTTVVFGAGGGAVLVDAGLAVTDADTNPITTATVAITGGDLPGDVLSFASGSNSKTFGDGATISASFNSGTGALAFTQTGSQASAADWQQALQSVTFNNTGTNPTDGGADLTRTLTWTANTANPDQTSVAVTSTIDVAPAPIIAGTAAGQTTTDESTISPFSGVSISDANIGQTETVTIVLSDPANGTLSNLGGGTFNSGTYVVTGSAASVTAAVDALVFTPTAHQVAPSGTVTTGFTISVVDSVHAASSDSVTSVLATSVNDPPVISNVGDAIGVPDRGTSTPFSALVVTDPDIGHTDTLTVTLSDPAGGTLSNLGGGSYNAVTGVYTVSGTPAAVTSALQGLVFTPAPLPPGSFVATTRFTVAVAGPGGTDFDDAISVTTVAQDAPGIDHPATSNTISISPDGSGFAPPTGGQTNEAVVSEPTNGGSYTLPDGYQAEFLGGTADATLRDDSVGGAVLVGNSGNDTIMAGADNDTLIGGTGNNTFLASGTSDVIGILGAATVGTSGAADTVFAGTGSLTLTDSGSGNAIGLSSGPANVTLSGSGASVFANTGSLSLVDSGTGNVIGGDSGAIAATLSGSGSKVYGGSGPLTVDVANTASGIAIGTGTGDATATIAGASTTVFGGAGSLTAVVQGNDAVIGLDGGTTVLTLAGSRAQVFGGAGDVSILDQGHADTIGAGSGATTVTGAGNGVVVAGGGGNLLFIGGSNDATVFGGSGSTSVTGGAGAVTLYGGAGGTIGFTGGPGQVTYQAGAGDETFQGGAASSGMIINGGIDAAGHDLLIGGSGNDSLFAGTGADTFTGGAGNDEFVFYKSVVAGSGPHDVITDFTANDIVYLAGYGGGEAASALASAVSSGGATTVTLSDNTRITFADVGSASGLNGHIVSF